MSGEPGVTRCCLTARVGSNNSGERAAPIYVLCAAQVLVRERNNRHANTYLNYNNDFELKPVVSLSLLRYFVEYITIFIYVPKCFVKLTSKTLHFVHIFVRYSTTLYTLFWSIYD